MVARRGEIERAYREQHDRLWRALFGYTGSRDVASDAAAEAFAQALAHREELRSPDDWVWTAAFRIARGQLVDRPIEGLGNEDSYDPAESVIDLVRALAQLPERQRLAVVLRDYADRPTAEVADVLGITTATVYVHLNHARKRLRMLLEERDA